jgi:AraC-like DNA-binding protein
VYYVTKPPALPLSRFVERFWYSNDAPRHQMVRIVPSGTMELVFNLDEDEVGFYDSEQSADCKTFSGAVFSGTYAQPLFVDTRKHVMGVHFKPGGAFRFLGLPASELANIHVNLETLWGTSSQELRGKLRAAANPSDRFRVLEEALVARLENTVKEHRAVRAALEIFKRDAGEATTRDLAAHLGLSQRQFIKAFNNQVGVTPRTFGRVQRFQHAADMTRSCSMPDWADVAAACGYFDQSHLIRDFKMFSGLSPTEFHRQRGQRLLTSAPVDRSIFSNTEIASR